MAISKINVNRPKIEGLCTWGTYDQVDTEITLSEPIQNYDMLIFFIGWDHNTAGKNVITIPRSICSSNMNLITRIGEIVIDVASQKVTIKRIVRNNPLNDVDGVLRQILGMRF